jgi:hypothetical protein
MAVEAASLDLGPTLSIVEGDDLLVCSGTDKRKNLLNL